MSGLPASEEPAAEDEAGERGDLLLLLPSSGRHHHHHHQQQHAPGPRAPLFLGGAALVLLCGLLGLLSHTADEGGKGRWGTQRAATAGPFSSSSSSSSRSGGGGLVGVGRRIGGQQQQQQLEGDASAWPEWEAPHVQARPTPSNPFVFLHQRKAGTCWCVCVGRAAAFCC